MKETLNKEHVIASPEGAKQSAVASEARQSQPFLMRLPRSQWSFAT